MFGVCLCVHLGEVFILRCITELLGAAFGGQSDRAGTRTREIQTQITPPAQVYSPAFVFYGFSAG